MLGGPWRVLRVGVDAELGVMTGHWDTTRESLGRRLEGKLLTAQFGVWVSWRWGFAANDGD
jgi:hypothetical protein